MKKIDLGNMSREQLQKTLKDLRLYRDLERELWERGKELFDRIQNGKHSYQIEHFSAVSVDLAWSSGKDIFKKVFKVEPDRDEVDFYVSKNLKGWIKVYFDDEVVDLSFDKVEKALKKWAK